MTPEDMRRISSPSDRDETSLRLITSPMSSLDSSRGAPSRGIWMRGRLSSAAVSAGCARATRMRISRWVSVVSVARWLSGSVCGSWGAEARLWVRKVDVDQWYEVHVHRHGARQQGRQISSMCTPCLAIAGRLVVWRALGRTNLFGVLDGLIDVPIVAPPLRGRAHRRGRGSAGRDSHVLLADPDPPFA